MVWWACKFGVKNWLPFLKKTPTTYRWYPSQPSSMHLASKILQESLQRIQPVELWLPFRKCWHQDACCISSMVHFHTNRTILNKYLWVLDLIFMQSTMSLSFLWKSLRSGGFVEWPHCRLWNEWAHIWWSWSLLSSIFLELEYSSSKSWCPQFGNGALWRVVSAILLIDFWKAAEVSVSVLFITGLGTRRIKIQCAGRTRLKCERIYVDASCWQGRCGHSYAKQIRWRRASGLLSHCSAHNAGCQRNRCLPMNVFEPNCLCYGF